MRPFDLNRALSMWRRAYRFNPAFSARDLDELERHLRDHIRHLHAEGLDLERAFHEAVFDLGDYRTADYEYRKVLWGKMRRLPTDYLDQSLAMLRSYIRLAYRSLRRNKTAAVINLTGLSIAIGVLVVCFVFVNRWFQVERFHTNADRIFVVGHTVERDGDEQKWVNSPLPLGPAMQADLPQVEQAVRFERYSTTVSYVRPDGERVADRQRLVFVDPAFLEVFSYPMVQGETSALTDLNSVVITQTFANKYFGTDDPLGATLDVALTPTLTRSYTVRGVLDRRPQASSIPFDVLLPFQTYDDLLADEADRDAWTQSVTATFLLLRTPEDVDAVAAQMDRYLALHNAVASEWIYTAFTFDNLRDLWRIVQDVRGEIAFAPPTQIFILITVISLLLLTLACFNYVNVALSTTQRRLIEIGIRKTLGGEKRHLVVQFLTENVVLCFLALVLGVMLAQAFLLPGFNALTGTALVIDYWGSTQLWWFLGAALVVVAMASGMYPAFHIARFEPIAILRDRQRLGHTSWLTRSLLTGQFVLAFITMFASIALVQNAQYQAQQDWGYDKEHLLMVPLEEARHYGPLAERLQQNPNVLQVAGTRHNFGENWGWATLDVDGIQMESVRFDVGTNYLAAMNVRLREGRMFEPDRQETNGVVVNEALVRARGWTAPIGQTFRVDGALYTVVGVLEDFHFFAFRHTIRPAFLRLIDEAAYTTLVLRTRPGTAVQTYDALAETWASFHPDVPFNGYFQDTVFDAYFAGNRRTVNVFAATATLTLFLSVMGLFGLAAQNVARRKREIGIRKVLGAHLLQVLGLVNRSFLVMIVVAFAIAAPLAYTGLGHLLDAFYAFRMPIGPDPFVAAFALIALAALATIATQFRAIAHANPADVLRAE